MNRCRASVVTLVVTSFAPFAGRADAAPAAEPDPAAVDQLAEGSVKEWQVPGLAVIVVRGEETLVLKGYGRRAFDRAPPISPETLFPMASCSKAFTAALLALLVDDGQLRWDEPVRKHLPGFKLSDPNADALLSVRDLLCHRWGLGSHDLLWYHAPWGIDDVLQRAGRLPLEYPFRGGYRYSTIPFLAAGRVAEAAGGAKWEKQLRTRLCEPLGMTGVEFTSDAAGRKEDRARGHRLSKAGAVEAVPEYEMKEPNPAGSVFASPRDVAAWLKFHLTEGRCADGTRLIGERNMRETHTPQNLIRLEGMPRVLNPDTTQLSYAMGWLVYDHRGKKVLSHGGMIDGFRVQLTFLPEDKLGIGVLANLHETRVNAVLTNSLIDLYCGLPPKDWNAFFRKVVDEERAARKASLEAQNKARNPAVKPSLPLTGFTGTYAHPAYGEASVAVVGQNLVLTWSGFKCRLDHHTGDTFVAAEGFFEDQLVPFMVAGDGSKAVVFAGQRFERR